MSPTPEARAHRKRMTQIGIAALSFLLIVNAATAALLILTRARTEAYATCAAQWQQQFSVAYVERDNANQARLASAATVSDAMDNIVTAIAKDDREGFNAAITNYLQVRERQNEVRAKQDEERAKNPLPPLPETLCGESP